MSRATSSTDRLFWVHRGLSSLLLVTVVAGACSPDTAGAVCEGDNDCFSDERCISGLCVAGPADALDDLPDDATIGPNDAGTDVGAADTSLIDDAVVDSGEAIGEDLLFDLATDAAGDSAETDIADATDDADAADVFDSTGDPDLGPASPTLLAYWRLDGYIGEESECLETLHGRINVVNGAFLSGDTIVGDGGDDMGSPDMGNADMDDDIAEPGDDFGALSFNGFSHIATGFTLDLDADTDVSILAWFKTSNENPQVILGFGSPVGARLQLLVSSDSLEVVLEDDLGAVSTVVAVTNDPPDTLSPVTDGEWHHIAMVRDTVAGSLSLYLDGALAAESDDETAVLSGSDQPLLLGGTGGTGGTGGLDGTLDDVLVIQGALGASDLAGYVASGEPWLERVLPCDTGRVVASLPLTIDFEGIEYGCLPVPWRLRVAEPASFVGVVADGCDHVLAHRIDRADNPAPYPTIIFSPASDDVIIEVSIRPRTPEGAYLPTALFDITAVSGAFASLGIYQSTFLYRDTGVAFLSGEALPQRWYRFRAELDVDQNTYDAFVDDEVYGSGGAFAAGTADSISSITFWASAFDIDDLDLRLANNSSLGDGCEFDFDCGGELGLECVNEHCYEVEIVDNGGFDDGLTDWDDLSNSCADEATIEILPSSGGHEGVLHLDSRSTSDCEVTFGQWIDVSTYDLSQLGVEYTWRVDAIEERSGQAEFIIDFVEPGLSVPAYSFRHVRGALDSAPCGDDAECIHDVGYSIGNWTQNNRLFDDFSFLPRANFDRIRLRVVSKSIGGLGADTFFDEVRLYVVPE